MKKICCLLVMALALSGCQVRHDPWLSASKELPIEIGNRTGRACSYSLLGFLGAFGDSSMATAARRAHISKITYYENTFDYFILWGERCSTVYGN